MTTPLNNVDLLTSDSKNPYKTPSSSSIEEGTQALSAKIKHLKSHMESISKQLSGTSSFIVTGKNSNFSFNVSRTLGF